MNEEIARITKMTNAQRTSQTVKNAGLKKRNRNSDANKRL